MPVFGAMVRLAEVKEEKQGTLAASEPKKEKKQN